MIRRKLLIATVIIASVVITACSDMTAPKKLVPGGLPAVAVLAPNPVAAADREGNRKHVTVVATIKGRGTAVMQNAPPGLAGTTLFYTGVKGVQLLSDGSATGDFTCIDLPGSDFPGAVSGKVTSWSREGTVIVLNVVSPDPAQPYSFIVKIQKFGGAGVGHWTAQESDPPSFGFPPGFVYCYELLTSGRIAIVYQEGDDRDNGGGDDSGR